MKNVVAAFIAGLSIFACSEVDVSDENERKFDILTEQQFVNELVGTTISWIDASGKPNKDVRIAILADGTFRGRGRFDDNITGKWLWVGDFWCRTVIGVAAAPEEDCQMVQRDGQDYLFIRNRGKGDAIRYRKVS
jgi:hypothetical protein